MSTFKQMYQILRRGHSQLKEVEVGGRKRKFWRRIIETPDKQWAQEVESKYPHDLKAIPFNSFRTDPTGIHKYSWGLSHLGDWKSRIDWSK